MDRYYLGSNTYKGFYGLYEEAIAPLDRVFLLKGGPGTGKSSLMKKVMKEGLNRGYSVECWHCSGDPNSLDGVLLKDLGAAVIDATSPHAVEPKIPVAKEVIINLLDCVRRDKIKDYCTHIEKLANDKKECFVRAYEHLKCGFGYFTQINRLLTDNVDMGEIDLVAREYALKIAGENMGDDKVKKKGASRRFFRAITPDGVVRFDDTMTDKKVIAVKGEDILIDRFVTTLVDSVGADVIFLNPYDADFVEGCVVGDVAVVRECDGPDCTVDLTDFEKKADLYALSRARAKLDEEIEEGVGNISKARSVHMGIERFYVVAMDFDLADKLTDRVLKDIFD